MGAVTSEVGGALVHQAYMPLGPLSLEPCYLAEKLPNPKRTPP